jgi:hypothetical protein
MKKMHLHVCENQVFKVQEQDHEGLFINDFLALSVDHSKMSILYCAYRYIRSTSSI